ncbi:biotin carboxylase activity protein [[Candida] boidinii]|uniref:Unnamed protein product n=1 Tax=Candida boidinii TaxID=5477 RepID=A0ACB5TE50_CANBO|nr:biotin carboxylase activity protein [[Candida] boidinii]GME86996.1 unnamed protein product [[Candida] boidinii]
MSEFSKVKRVLIANRGEIACRVIRTCKKYNLTSIAICSKEDIESLHVSEADEAVLLPGVGAAAYINIENVVKAAQDHKADVVIPGYGFLSENSDFAAKLAEINISFAGPSSESVEQFGLKHLARKIAISCDVPVVPGSDLVDNSKDVLEISKNIGFPVILKSTAGGGGMGLKVCYSEEEVEPNFKEVTSRGASLFSNSGVFVEKYVEKGRHIEVQVFGNGLGDVISYGERECSIQRRHQKVIEETPSPFVQTLGAKYDLRKNLTSCAKRLASQINYKSAGTVEFLVDDDTGKFYFLEMNTRLQVEHGITEMVYGVDLVYFMLLQCEYEINNSGIPVDILKGNLKYDTDGVEIPNGHAIEVRAYAENPVRDFAPSPGILHNVDLIEDGEYEDYKVRVDHWISTGGKVSPYFDPLLAKIMVWSPTRTSENIIKVLKETKIQGVVNNIEYCTEILNSSNFKNGNTLTNFLSSFEFRPHLLEFEEAGAYTTIQDSPGRRKIRTGVPHGGPADSLSLQIANITVGNDKNTACLEINMKGPVIKFHNSAVIAIAGASFEITLNGKEVPMATEIFVPMGSILDIGEPTGKSCKCYLAVKGGLPGVAEYLGSKSCIPSLSLGGHQGRIIFPGDCLETDKIPEVTEVEFGYSMPKELLPSYEVESNVIRMIGGPHDTEDICSVEGLKQLYSVDYSVNFNSNRGAMRLDGPEMIFSRGHGGDGGGHPSNILEYPYPTCGLSTVGSTMVLFGIDGATLSGFTCVSVPTEVDFWKFGQAAVNSPLKFKLITFDDAIKLMKQREEYLKLLETRPKTSDLLFNDELESYELIDDIVGKFLYKREASGDLPYVAFRQAGERMVIVDFGTEKFNLFSNGRQYALDLEVKKQVGNLIESTECSSGAYCFTFDPLKTDRDTLIKSIIEIEASIPPIEKLKVPSRIFKLPVCFEHTALKHCIERYTHSQRPHAPYLPSNVDYLMKANCIDTIEQFKDYIVGKPEVVVAVSFLCANPLLVNTDPRRRFMTSKYNPSRTSTPAGTIGSGSVSQSIYSVESPGGYMIWGMTLPNWYWDTFCRFHEMPWPLKNFDQVIYYEVDEEELTRLNNLVLSRKLRFEPEASEFDFVEYSKFIESIKEETDELLVRKRAAFSELTELEAKDMALWEQEKKEAKASKTSADSFLNDPNCVKVLSHMPANVYKINFKKGDIITADDVLIILEAMKMEIPIKIKDKKAGEGTKYEILETIVDEGDIVNPGDLLAAVKRLD